ncbi:GDP-L-fucose synthetase (EC [Olavius algarvensis associated proteobacterium Delta 3]|nr:GDP-L-fucose synthetase (EC [Olavius algarvensis associated proteobacterium Delta 3]CAB5100931.1 GDP-L-fucose synthetase (EC [Olavius algarvensis associated proteobacterium Delta 3]
MVGSAILRALSRGGYRNIVYRTHRELDLTRQAEVERFFEIEQPEYVFLAAARVGGIRANDAFPGDFSYTNLAIQTHVIHAAYKQGAHRLLFLGSSCIYSRHCPQPMKEEHLLTGPLEKTNEPYALAKISGVSQCQSYNRQYGTRFLAAMPTNLYGPEDHYDLSTSHVLPALIRKFHLARLAQQQDWEAVDEDAKVHGPIPEEIKEAIGYRPPAKNTPPPHVRLWGTGSPHREFLYVDDLAVACLFLMNLPDEQFDRCVFSECRDDPSGRASKYAMPLINIGCTKDQTIRDLAQVVADIVGFDGKVSWDTTKPDGTPRKLLDTSRMTGLGWKAKVDLEDGIRMAYEAYLKKIEAERTENQKKNSPQRHRV